MELIAPIAEGIERVVETARAGSSFGQLSFLDRAPALGLGRFAEPTRVLTLSRDSFDEFAARMPTAGLKVLTWLAEQLSARMRLLGAQYIQSVAWGVAVSGATQLGLDRLIADRTEITLALVSGRAVSGELLKVEDAPGGRQIYMRSLEGQLMIVPYHAVTVARLPGEIVEQVARETEALNQ